MSSDGIETVPSAIDGTAGPEIEAPPEAGMSRSKVMAGARRLLGRQVAGMAISVVGMFLLARMIGPTNYGVYTAAFGIAFFLQNVGGLGIGVYLKRVEGTLAEAVCDQAFTLLILLAVATVGLSIAALPLLAAYMGMAGFGAVAAWMFGSVAVTMMQQVALSRLERALDYGRIGRVEVSAQACFFLAALPLAHEGFGPWAPVCGWWLQQIVLLVGYWWGSSYRPRLSWRPPIAREIVTYGVTSTVATAIFGFRPLTGPLIVGRFLGPTALGYVSLAIRLLEQLSLARQVISRLAIPVFSQIGSDRERFRRAFTSAMEVQFLAVAAPTVGFVLVASFVVPLVFGHKWAPVADLIPLLAPAYLAMGAFYMHNLVLTIAKRPTALVLSQGANALLLFLSSLLLVPRFGIVGYAYAELITIAAWLVSDRLVAKSFPRPDYRATIVWLAGAAATSLAPLLGWWLLAAAPAVLLVGHARREVLAVIQLVLKRR